MKPVAIVIPWFGPDANGGAEQQALQIATRLAARKHAVEVLTTCNRSFHDDWSVNHYAAGATSEYGVTIRRFSVDPRDAAAFDRVNAKLLAMNAAQQRPGVSPVTANDAHSFVHENMKSAALLEHLQNEHEAYHAFLFLPYMFAPSVLGLPLVADRAWLQPCLHDEPAAYLPHVAAMFRQARGLLLNSSGELELALRLFGPGIYDRSQIVGEGIEAPSQRRGGEKIDVPAELVGKRYALYLGRRDRTKNTDLLVRAFAQFKSEHPESELELVLAGPGTESFAGAGVHDLGFVPDETKRALLKNCAALAQPSRNESFSRTMMEAWSCGHPVLVQRDCLATATAVRESGGGFLAGDESEWAQLLARVAETSDRELTALGKVGRAYAAEVADWKKVIPRYEDRLGLIPGSKRSKAESRPSALPRRVHSPRAIHQLLPDLAYGDAISNQACAIRNHLRSVGYESEIFVKRREPRLETEALLWPEAQPSPADALLYHHSIGSELTAFAADHAGPKCLIYHNITPAKFFEPYRPGFAWMLETGRSNLPRLAPHFTVSVGDSAFNAAELSAVGFHRPGVLPIVIDPQRWNIAPDDALMARLQDGQTNLLFVGRIAPNKQQHRLIEIFAGYHELDPHSRLIIAGEARASDPYSGQLHQMIEALDLSEHVEITGRIEDAALLAYYRTAHLYCSPSAHEGFGAPLVEAMWFDVPVLALRATAVPETLGDAGVLFDRDESPAAIAARAYELIHDPHLRESVIAAQRKRRLEFTSAKISSSLTAIVEQLKAGRHFGKSGERSRT